MSDNEFTAIYVDVWNGVVIHEHPRHGIIQYPAMQVWTGPHGGWIPAELNKDDLADIRDASWPELKHLNLQLVKSNAN